MDFNSIVTAINLLLTLALAAATIFLAWATVKLAIETRKMREIRETPRLDIRVERKNESSSTLNLVLQNVGQGVAKNVRFIKFEGDPSYYTETVISPKDWKGPTELPIFKKGVAQWESGQIFSVLLGGATKSAYERAAENAWRFHVQYENQSGTKMCQIIEVDFSLLGGAL